MLDLTALDLWVSEQLQPARQELGEKGVPIAMLPKEAASYTRDESQGFISVAIPQVSGVDPGDRGIGQHLIYEISVLLRLPKRYQDKPEEKKAIEYLADLICHSLIKKHPLGDADIITPVWLLGYELLQPQGGQWTASLSFRFKRSTTAKFENYQGDYEESLKLIVEFLTRGEEEPKEAVELSLISK